MRSCGAEVQVRSSDPTEKSDTIVVCWQVLRCRQDFSLFRWSVVPWKTRVLAAGHNYRERRLFHPSPVSWHFLASTRNARSAPGSPVSLRNTGRSRRKKRGGGEGRERATCHHRVGKAGSFSGSQDERKMREREKERKKERTRRTRHEGRRARRREGRVAKRSKEIRAGTEKGEKKGEGATR